ncbi:MAG TPA: GntR family transcriptional regulator [Bosea sp. (in: a-proteobacteria)]|jgi:DNA-binding GntR family transcriptional regulator|uniref:GntR family transcriptional regulator n=1 Tax=Bosea sp. (in: a-proteobacteria) TaxID=1871050 RepID=UPI002DDD6E61|nr:GntR family transcriptional regulator [Bosea sp. (in: a-proteobacteria)]HEV2556109.1 GntR family transcriptional regulator [Bosea sp. (in: a-proteobacteria)]
MNEAAIHTILSRLLLGGSLPGGTKLGEHRLAEIFGVSRERIRKVLHRLGHERLLEIVKNRGAFTIEPDLREGRVVYEARRILESGMVAHLADHLTEAQIARLREHVDAEADALRRGDQPTWLKLSAQFHFLLAEMIGNPIVQRQAHELIGRTIMLVKRYETTLGSACGCEEHRLIFKALAGRERGRAVKAMSSHLSLVETRLRPIVCDDAGPSLEALLEEAIAAFRAERGEGASPRHEAPAAPTPR